MPDETTTQAVNIGIAVVFHQEKILVGVRRDDVPLPGKAEFPGGKCLPDESTQQCAMRECFEETGLNVIAQQLLHQTEHQYPYGLLHLDFWLCEPTAFSEIQESHKGYRWVKRQDLAQHNFPEANQQVIELLMKRSTDI